MCSREKNGDILTLAASGWTYFSTFVLYDHQTWTMWVPREGIRGLTGITGPLANGLLMYRPSVKTTWDEWVAGHPDSKYLHVPR